MLSTCPTSPSPTSVGIFLQERATEGFQNWLFVGLNGVEPESVGDLQLVERLQVEGEECVAWPGLPCPPSTLPQVGGGGG